MENENKSNIGSYKKLIVYKKTALIYKITHHFCTTYLDSKDRTVDQMIQAARSGKQNIVEGCSAGKKSLKSKEFLINVAKSSLKELLEDYDIVKNRPPEVIANIAIVLINQADYLLYKFQQKLGKTGITSRLKCVTATALKALQRLP